MEYQHNSKTLDDLNRNFRPTQPRPSELKDFTQMKQNELSELTDQELLDEAKKMKSTSITNAVFIGLMIGIVIYSILKNSLGFFTLIPLFFAYKAFNNSKYNIALEKLLKERNLK